MLGNLKLLPLCVCVSVRDVMGSPHPLEAGQTLGTFCEYWTQETVTRDPTCQSTHTPKDAIEEFVSLLDELGGVGDLKLHPAPPSNPKRNQVVRRHTV